MHNIYIYQVLYLLEAGKVKLAVDIEQHIRALSCADVGILSQDVRLGGDLALSFYCLRFARRGGLWRAALGKLDGAVVLFIVPVMSPLPLARLCMI